ncbi:ankyrin [Piromyces finnis]|uniref:Ankyrin n=1 Tax=Piromyces finnis TaxID=1754191 RepID=A0A1Y1VDF6_9FUNG|nr:ankyrin [Piromyces finnis]|eukprot:ORX53361.1 ankyrin [Piromyces finnis]
MLSRNEYDNRPIQQQQSSLPLFPFEQQGYENKKDSNENYYSSIGKYSLSYVKRNKSFKSILKKFQNATINSHFDKVQYYVEKYGLLNETEHSLCGGRTCLMLSISRENYKLIEYFCQQEHINLDVKDNNGDTALHIACSLGNMKIIKTLINRGCDPFVKNNCGSTPLFNIVYHGFDKVCKSTLSLYQEKFGFVKTLQFVNSQDNEGKTALMYGAMGGKKSYNCVIVLLSWNADTEILDNHGWNSFTYASYHGNFDICQKLLARRKKKDDSSASEELVFNINNNHYLNNENSINDEVDDINLNRSTIV